MSRRLKPVKDLSVLILAERKHDRQLWAELLKNCGINNPLSMSEIEQATVTVASGQVDVVFVDESYGPRGIANVLIPARNVEFAGGRGVCLILCSKKATAQDVINARKLGFASMVILPASTGTVQKHLELAARYIPPSDEELGWSAPKIKAQREAAAMPAPKDEPSTPQANSGNAALLKESKNEVSPNGKTMETSLADAAAGAARALAELTKDEKPTKAEMKKPDPDQVKGEIRSKKAPSSPDEEDEMSLQAPGRSGQSVDEELVFL